MPYLGIFRLKFEFFKMQELVRNKKKKFGTKNALFGYFGAEI